METIGSGEKAYYKKQQKKRRLDGYLGRPGGKSVQWEGEALREETEERRLKKVCPGKGPQRTAREKKYDPLIQQENKKFRCWPKGR